MKTKYLSTLFHQPQMKNETLAQDAFAIAKFVGLDKNSATTSDWITTLNSSTTTGNTSPSIPYTPIIYYNDPTYFNNNYNYTDYYNYNYGGNSGSDLYYGGSVGYTVYAFPVVLDLDGDGVELVSQDQSHAWFDTTGDGTLHKTGWVGADDGLLVIDENGDGKITYKEMAFAARTATDDTDMQALASEFDTNQDGQLDANDAQFSKFRIWKDANGNGETDAGELMSLAQANVASVGLNSTAVSIDIEGNKIAGFASYTKTDGTSGSVSDTAFAYDSKGYTVTQKTGYTQLSQTDGLSYAIATETALNLDLVTAEVDGAIGGSGNDTFSAVGKTTDVVLEGGEGNDVLTGGSGNDWLKGGTGNDTLKGGDGNDTIVMDSSDTVANINGGAGFDTFLVDGTGAVTIDLNARGFESAVGSDGNDTFSTSGNGRVVLLGKAGNDTLTGGGNGDLLEGGTGNDTLNGRGGNDIYGFSFGDGVDTINEYETKTYTTNVWQVVLRPQYDPYTGAFLGFYSYGYWTIVTTTVVLSYGNDTIQLGKGITVENIDIERSGNDLILALRDAGNTTAIDTLSDRIIIKNFNNVNSTIENLSFADSSSILLNDWQIGTSGNDTLSGNSRIYGGRGNDTYTVDSINDIVIENSDSGADTVKSNVSYSLTDNVENLTLTGTASIDGTGNELDNVLTGNSGKNILHGGYGNDKLDGKLGDDAMYGGIGDDSYVVDNIGDVVIDNVDEGVDTVSSSITYTLGANLENLTLTGTTAINGTGNELNNVLTGNSGANVLDGGDGNDTLNGGGGADSMLGGAGDDTYTVANIGDKVYETTTTTSGIDAGGIDTIESSVTYTLSINVENLTLIGTAAINATGNELDNMLTGNSAANILDGKAGADTMIGGLGNDIYYVDNIGDSITESSTLATEIDTVNSSITYTLGANLEKLTLTDTAIDGTGNELNNTLSGNSTANILDGKAGADTMIGGLGNDIYYVDNTGDVVTESSTLTTEIDTVISSITYTLGANVEKLSLIGTDAINATGNTLANTLIGNGGDNVLNGGTGIDTLIGGLGDDTYIVNTITDTLIENVNEGVDTIKSSISYTTLDANIENLTLTGTAAINGTGVPLPIK